MSETRRTFVAGLAALAGSSVLPRIGEVRANPSDPYSYSSEEIIEAGHHFFGSISKGLAQAVEYLFQSQGDPTGYIVGEEGGGALVAGLRFGEGMLHTKHTGVQKVYWQGPSLGWDIGADGARTMMLVYNLAGIEQMYHRYPGVNGSAYLVAGAGVSLYSSNYVTVAPIRSGVGARLGVNLGYLKFTPNPTWNPF